MKVMSEENQEFADYVSSLKDTEVIYDSDYDNPTFDSNPTNPIIDTTLDSESTKSAIDPTCGPEPAACNLDERGLNSCNLNECSLNVCNLDDGELNCGDDFADNGDTIQGGPCQDLIEYFSDKPYLD